MSPASTSTCDLLRCHGCHSPLDWRAKEAGCSGCGEVYPIVDGIPVFADPAREQGPQAAYKATQIDFFDAGGAEFEIARPHGSPALYRWVIDEKQRRVLHGLDASLVGITALVVCGGSGMDAEYLARAGARVIVSDISLGAIRRARERARRGGLSMLPIVADAERLPFADAGVDLCWVHDGLHHLEDPLVGVLEMARVAARYLCITEPARARLTALAVRLGIALEHEEAGNRVERIEPAELLALLGRLGFSVSHWERYAMYYRHQPGAITRLLSHPRLFGPVTTGQRKLNRAFGRFGNKLAVQAIRVP